MGSHLVVICVALGQIALAEDYVQYTAKAAEWPIPHDEKYDDHSVTAYVDVRKLELGNDLNLTNLQWDGTIIKPTDYPFDRRGFHEAMCPDSRMIRGLQELYDQNKPFEDAENPTKAEVDHWHVLGINHIRALVGYTEDERQIQADVCLHMQAFWSDQKKSGEYYPGPPCDYTCYRVGHCGAGCTPKKEDQTEYLDEQNDINSDIFGGPDNCPDEICIKNKCSNRAGSEGILGWSPATPWGVRFSETFCTLLEREGFWGGHVGPWFGRSLFGWNMWYEKGQPPATFGLRAKWGGKLLPTKYKNPATGDFNSLHGVPARFQNYQCDGTVFFLSDNPNEDEKNETRSATDCFNLMEKHLVSNATEKQCGGRYFTKYSDGNCGCSSTSECTDFTSGGSGPSRLTFDTYEPRPSNIGDFIIDEVTGYAGKRGSFICNNPEWELTWGGQGRVSTGDAWDCLNVTLLNTVCGKETGIDDWEDRHIIYNSANSGCGCYRNLNAGQEGSNNCQAGSSSSRRSYRIRKTCPDNFPHYNADDLICECPPTKPYAKYNGAIFAECEECPDDKPYYDRDNRECIPCGDEKSVFDKDKLICKCPSEKPLFNAEKEQCEACPADLPYFDEDLEKCVEACPVNLPYVEGTKCVEKCPDTESYYDPEDDNRCLEACPSGRKYYKKESNGMRKCVGSCPV